MPLETTDLDDWEQELLQELAGDEQPQPQDAQLISRCGTRALNAWQPSIAGAPISPAREGWLSRLHAWLRRATPERRSPALIGGVILLLSFGATAATWLNRESPKATPVVQRQALPLPIAEPLPKTTKRAKVREAPPEPMLTALPEVEAPPRVARRPAQRTSASLFRDAKQAQRVGDGALAERLLRQLQQKFSSSPEAQVSRVSLARLLLDSGRAAEALTYYDAYLSGGSSLRPEALSGKARTLESLGRRSQAKSVWERLLRESPNSAQGNLASKRLKTYQ